MKKLINSALKQIFVRFFILLPMVSFSQESNRLDSLLSQLKKESLSTEENASLLIDIAYYHSSLDSSIYYANKALRLSIAGKKPVLQAQAWEEIGFKERKLGNLQKSFQASFNALAIYESLEMIENQAATYNQIANNYMSDQNYIASIFYLKKAKNIYNKSDKQGNQLFTILNLGEMYRLAGFLDSAKLSFKKVLQLNIKRQNNIAASYSLGNLGMIHNMEDSLVKAKIKLRESVALLKKMRDPYATSVYLATLGDVYRKEGNIKTAEAALLEALTIARDARLKEQIRDFGSKLSEFYETQGNFTKALKYQKLFQVYQDSLVNKANIQGIERLKAGYEIDKRESKIGLLSTINTKQKHLVWALGGGVLATLIFLYLLYRGITRVRKANNTLAEQKEIISQREQEKALLLQELNHRVKNNLQMISGLLNLQSRELAGHPAKEVLEEGKDRVEALSLVHQKLYQEGVETRIELKEYLEELVLGLFYGYNASFEPNFELDDTSISIDTAVPLALIVNEMVINTLKYAYSGVESPTFTLKAKEIGSNLTIQVIDNGRGFTYGDGEKKNSFGLKLIRSLVAQLQGTLKKLEGDGTRWQVQLKLG